MRIFVFKRKHIIFCLIGLLLPLITMFLFAEISTDTKESIPVPVIMYHSVLKNKDLSGRYIVTPESLEEDLYYFKNNGFSTVFIDDIINYIDGVGNLPVKPIVLTFDDGYLNNLTNLLPLLEKYDMCACVSVVGEYTEKASTEQEHNPNYSYLSYDDINTCLESGRIEIGCHSYSMHKNSGRKGVLRLYGEEKEKYKNKLLSDTETFNKLLYENCEIKTNIYAFPFGAYKSESMDILKEKGYRAFLNCEERINYVKRGDYKILDSIGRFNRPSYLSVYDFMKRIYA